MPTNNSTNSDHTPHQPEVLVYLQKQFATQQWDFIFPHSGGKETYIAHGNGHSYFVKLGAPLANYQTMASLGLTPPVIATGVLEDGTSLLAQPYVDGRKPTWTDFHSYLDQIASIVGSMHHDPELRRILTPPSSERYNMLGLEALVHLQEKWDRHKTLVPAVAEWVDEQIDQLLVQIEAIEGTGAVAAHNDICNANWLISTDGQIYLIDLDAMSLDDPAGDLGAILWWYYPPELRPRFIEIAGYQNDEQLHTRMRLRMAIHCLDILLAREQSFDQFDAARFVDSLADFRAILAGEENPQGYG